MARVPEHFIQDVLSRLDIVPLIQTYVPLKKMGTNFGACCPFHNEKTPSFTVSSVKQFYHCFGCGEHGDAISFVSKIEHLTFLEALEKLAHQVGLMLPQDTSHVTPEFESLYVVLEKAKAFYCQQLRSHPGAIHAVTYLKGRGLTGEIAKTFSIGFAPPGWSNLLERLSGDQKALEEAGLIIPGQKGKPYDRFRARIMFPILDTKGRTIGFGARSLGDELPKYLNSPETPLFHKGKQFYGLFEALQQRTWTQLVVVEGYLDVIALTQHGFGGVVATLGTALTEMHIKMLFKYASQVTFCFDGDVAGQKAAEKALMTVLPEIHSGREVKFAFLPNKHDPDSFVREKGREAFDLLLENAVSLSDYFFQSALKNVSTASLTKKAAMIEAARATLERLPKGMYRTLLEDKLSDLIPARPKFRQAKLPPESVSPAIKAALMLVCHPPLHALITRMSDLMEQTVEGMSMLKLVLAQFTGAPLTSENLSSLCEQNGLSLTKYEAYMQSLSGLSSDGLELEFKGAVMRVFEIGRHHLMEKLLEKAKKGELSDMEKQKLKNLLM